jgi:hypothetical protein
VDPRYLPCGESACHECILKSIKNNSKKQFECPFCEKIHEAAGKESFPKNKVLLKLIKMKAEEVYRYKNFEDLKAKLSEMKTKCDQFKLEIDTDNGIDQIQEQCAKLRNQVHLRTEVLIEQVHQINEKMIADIDENEKACIQLFNDKIGELRKECGALITKIYDFYDIKSKYVTQFKIDENVVEELLVNTKGHINKLDRENEKLQNIKCNNKMINFTNSSFEFEEKLIGILSNKYVLFEEIKFKNHEDDINIFLLEHDDNSQKAVFYCKGDYNLGIDLLDSKGKSIKHHENVLVTMNGIYLVSKSSANYILSTRLGKDTYSMFDHPIIRKKTDSGCLILIDRNFKYLKHKFIDYNAEIMVTNDSNILCVNSDGDFYYYDMDLKRVHNKLFEKMTEKVDRDFYEIMMTNSYLFILYSNEEGLEVFDLNSFDLVKKIDVKADVMKLVSTSYLILFDSYAMVLYLYDQSSDFKKLDQVDLALSLESRKFECTNRDQSPTFSFYNYSVIKTISFFKLFNISLN